MSVAATGAATESRGHRTVLASSMIGTTVEWYDFFLYSTASSLVFGRLFFPPGNELAGTMLSFATFFVGFLARPIGAVLFGHIGDRLGRKRTLVTTMLIMGGATALVGVLPTYAQAGIAAPILLVVLRILQGLAIGGEWAGAVLLAVEHAPAHRRGWYGSWPQVGLGIGLALGTGLFALLGQAMADEQFLTYGWRAAFLLSIVLVVIGLVVRLKVEETPEFERMRAETPRETVPFVELFRDRASRRHVVLGLLARWGDGVAFNTWAVFAITYCTTTLKMDRTPVLVAVTVAALLMALLIPFAGRAADRFGPRRTYLAGMVFFGLSVVPAFLGLSTGEPLLVGIALVLALGVVYALSYAPEGTLFAQLFPTRTRYTGMSFVYQFSGIYASGLTPMLITALFALGEGSLWWVCAYLVATAVISTVATAAIRPRDLHLTGGR
ncbi:MFS transporter [Prauserella flavalba]|uniref:Putative proline/betaine transporter n=1 Tax=Prauserella flavalba TaxID=1477506 RepID=A0A318LQ43_9PSEU|nr:MFS transporter [Prauserella flavalba]PXY35484.1 MFS transporter [Prauserella flavalba]